MTDDSGEFHPGAFRRSLRGPGITATEHRVAVELSEYANPGDPIVWPSVKTLAADCGVKERAITKALSALKAKRVIAEVGSRKGGRGQSTRWQLIVRNPVRNDTLSDLNPVTNDTLSGPETLSFETETLSFETENPVRNDTRSSKEVGQEVESGAAVPESLDVAAVPEPGHALSQIHSLTKENGHASRAADADPYLGLGPRPTCPRHPNGTTAPCHTCGANKAPADEWDREHAKRKAAAAARRTKNIRDCPNCDERGWVDGGNTVRRCPNHFWPVPA